MASSEDELVAAIAAGDKSARGIYADELEQRGELAKAMFLRVDVEEIDPRWLASLGYVVVGRFIFQISPELRQGGFHPIAFQPVAHFVAGVSSVVVELRAGESFEMGRLIATAKRSGLSSRDMLYLARLQLDDAPPIGINLPLDVFAPDRLPVLIDERFVLSPGSVLRATIHYLGALRGRDRIDVSLATLGRPVLSTRPELDFGFPRETRDVYEAIASALDGVLRARREAAPVAALHRQADPATLATDEPPPGPDPRPRSGDGGISPRRDRSRSPRSRGRKR